MLTLIAAAAILTDPQVRAFLDQQERRWNAGDLAAYYAAFRPDAVFVDQYRTPSGQLVPYGKSTLAEARTQTKKFRAKSKSAETHQVLRITVTSQGATAQTRVTARLTTPAGPRTTCAVRTQTLTVTSGRLRSSGHTDTFMRCAR